jgi:hypothetical protein
VDERPQRRHLVVAFPLGDDAVAVLADRLGSGFAVRDIRADGPAADIVLAPPSSPQLIAHLKRRFPDALVVITELEDVLRNVHLGGPVSRALDGGADAYYVAKSTEALGTFLGALPLAGREALAAQDQPIALGSAAEIDDLVSRVREAATPEPAPARRSDPTTAP